MGAEWLSSVAQQAAKQREGVAYLMLASMMHCTSSGWRHQTTRLCLYQPSHGNKGFAADGRYMAAYKLLTASGQQHGTTYDGMVKLCQEQGLGNFTRLQVGLLAPCLKPVMTTQHPGLLPQVLVTPFQMEFCTADSLATVSVNLRCALSRVCCAGHCDTLPGVH